MTIPGFSYVNSGIRFGRRDHKQPLNSEVRVYKLSDEELENYRKGDMKMKLTKEKYIELKEQKKTDKEIRAEYDLDNNHLYTLKKQWDVVNKLPKANAVESKNEQQGTIDWKTVAEKAAQKVERLEESLKQAEESKGSYIQRIKKLFEEHKELKQENQRLDDENAELQNRLDNAVKSNTQLQNEMDQRVYTELAEAYSEEPDVGWEEMKDDAARYKAMHDKLLEYVKVVM